MRVIQGRFLCGVRFVELVTSETAAATATAAAAAAAAATAATWRGAICSAGAVGSVDDDNVIFC